MTETYDHKTTDKKWQDAWEKDELYQAPQHPKKKKPAFAKASAGKQYILDMFPYPSGAGLHVGHPEGYTATDILSRFLRMQGYDVLHPMGWDAFGLPAENYAIKEGVKPAESTAKNIKRFREQIKSIGLSYDWSREINTSDSDYYKWTQWLFLQFYKKGLAYKKEAYVNWCPKDQTVLANEQVINGACERCGTKVIQKSLSQWFFKITDYADRLLNDLENLDWPEPIKLMQKNWIGRSEGAEIEFAVETYPLTPSQREGESIKRFVILHGKGSTPDDNYYPWLKNELEKQGFEVQAPQMPNASEPDDDEQTDFVQKNCILDEKTVVVGHSFGGVVALRLAERMKLGGIVLVATPFTGDFLDKKDRPSVKTAVQKGFDFKKIKENAGYIEVLGDTKDHIVSITDGEAFADKFGVSLLRVKAQKSHFGGKQESAILTAVLTHPPTPSQREGENPPPNPLPKGGGEYAEFGYYTTDAKTWTALQEKVLEMRKNPTTAEEKLWQSLRKNLTGYHFRRQQIIGRFIVDFVCLEKFLVVEVDGDIHDFQKKEDEERTEFLKEKGFRVIRFRNEKVIKNLDEVVKNITKDLDSWENTPPLWGGAGGGVIKVFTTRPDTLFGATYMVLAPEHPLVEQITTAEQKNYVINYVIKTKEKTEIQRTSLEKEKTGVFTGAYAINPATKEKIPVWIADYVLMNYGTGAIMAVPAHDERDFEFAKKYNLPIKQVVAPETGLKREDEQRRDGGCGIIFDPKTQKYGVSKKPEGFYGFFGGGVHDSEDEQEGILREVSEESGLYDFGHIEKIAVAFPHYHNEVKKVNRFTKAACYLIILNSAKVQSQKLEEHEKLELVWAKPEEILQNWQSMTHFKDLNDTEHWRRFLSEAVARTIELGFDKTSDSKKYKAAAFTESGILINSGKFDGTESEEAKGAITKFVGGNKKIQYKLRDWLVSRQRYWGAPIPIIYCDKCGMQAVPEEDLPVKLPTDVDFLPTGESPIARSKTFHKVKCPSCGESAKRDSDTMDTFVDSSWYFFRFADPHNDQAFADKKKMKEWLPVDTYVGGAEHAVLHLLYARFFTKALSDLGYIHFEEPFLKLRNQGLILGPDGEKMSKSRGNVINPDEVIAEFGADAFRMYEMFMGPLEEAKPWQTNGIVGVKRFLDKVYRTTPPGATRHPPLKGERKIHKLIKKITSDIENFKFNTAIAAFMEFLNENKEMAQKDWETFLILLAPFAPHITEELWHQLGYKDSIHTQSWPKFDDKLTKEDTVTVVVQVLGRVRATLEMKAGSGKSEVVASALADANVKKHLAGKEIVKEIFVQDKLINFVVK